MQIRENEIATRIVDSAYQIHTRLGPGLYESVYVTLLVPELTKRGLQVSVQHPIPLIYDDLKFEHGSRADLLVEGLVIVEVKSVEALAPVHFKQVLTYLRLSEKQLGLLINFNVDRINDGVRRIVCNLPEKCSRNELLTPNTPSQQMHESCLAKLGLAPRVREIIDTTG